MTSDVQTEDAPDAEFLFVEPPFFLIERAKLQRDQCPVSAIALLQADLPSHGRLALAPVFTDEDLARRFLAARPNRNELAAFRPANGADFELMLVALKNSGVRYVAIDGGINGARLVWVEDLLAGVRAAIY